MYPRKFQRKPRAKKVARKKPAKLTKQVKQAVTQIVKRNMETKYATEYLVDTPFNGTITSLADWYAFIPDVGQAGPSQQANGSGRIGNIISPTSLSLNINVSIGNDVARSVDIYCVLYVFTLRDAKSQNAVATGNVGPSHFLDTGNGGLNSFNGYAYDMELPVNSTGFTVLHKRIFRLCKGTGLLNNDTTQTSVASAGVSGRRFNFRIPTPATLKYEMDASLTPTNFAPQFAIGYAHIDGTPPDNLRSDIRVSMRSKLYYKDA